MKNKIPKNWNQINIDKYQKLYNLYKIEQDYIELTFKRLSILLDKSYEEIEQIPITEYNEIKETLEFVNSEPKQTNFKTEFELNGKKFKFRNINELNFGEFMDLEHYKSDCIENMHRIMNILYVTDNKEDNSDFLKHNLNIETALSCFFFIYLFALNFLPSNMEGYSQLDIMMTNMKKEKKKIKKILKEKVLNQ